MRYRLTRISLWSAARTAFIICGVIGFGLGAFYGLILAAIGQVINLLIGNGSFEGLGVVSGVAGVFVAVFFAMLSGVTGALLSVLVCWLYNVMSHVAGGLELELDLAPAIEPEAAHDEVEPRETTLQDAAPDEPSAPDPGRG